MFQNILTEGNLSLEDCFAKEPGYTYCVEEEHVRQNDDRAASDEEGGRMYEEEEEGTERRGRNKNNRGRKEEEGYGSSDDELMFGEEREGELSIKTEDKKISREGELRQKKSDRRIFDKEVKGMEVEGRKEEEGGGRRSHVHPGSRGQRLYPIGKRPGPLLDLDEG
jgi:hypothetical protein